MSSARLLPTLAGSLALACALTGTAVAASAGDHRPTPSVTLTPTATYATGVFDRSAAEIPAWDPSTQRLFVVDAEAGSVDVLDASTPGALTKLFQFDAAGVKAADGSTIPKGAVANSVSISKGIAAVAVEHPDKVQRGWVVLFRTDAKDAASVEIVGAVRVGALPDSLSFTPRGDRIVVANEAEPAEDYSSDPEGSISIIDVPKGDDTLVQDDVRTARFTAYDQGTALPEGTRVHGPDAPVPAGQEPAGRIARNLEPEYVTVDAKGRTAYVTVQEANAVAVVDLGSASITDLWTLPLKDWSAAGNVLDTSDKDDAIALRNAPIVGIPQPDGIDAFTHRGRTYVVTANEGDSRDWDGYSEEVRVGSKKYPLCADAFGGEAGVAALKKDDALGRLNVTLADGKRAGADCYETIHAFGGRSFSIFTADGTQVFESGALLEKTVADLIAKGELPKEAFNANHAESPSFDKRSDDKGVEPEDVEVGEVEGRRLLFVGLERLSGVMTFDITDPANPAFLTFTSTRDWGASYDEDNPPTGSIGDLGTEGMVFIPAKHSPTGTPMLATASEVSGTTTLFEIGLTANRGKN